MSDKMYQVRIKLFGDDVLHHYNVNKKTFEQAHHFHGGNKTESNFLNLPTVDGLVIINAEQIVYMLFVEYETGIDSSKID